ncbi:hypothetical protein FOL47_004300 [Perkinsus chesapeaki]|uniref:Bifunctional lysine-specific demethylase and histidyl-hydroxylase n=1 Tax=Perkinsus chesapeaki TaxID=330153 RepID=A0A7J6M4D6_PERCH|nr:hypothetical protein FOL47_004300 [Perkinsus chesapeaki]
MTGSPEVWIPKLLSHDEIMVDVVRGGSAKVYRKAFPPSECSWEDYCQMLTRLSLFDPESVFFYREGAAYTCREDSPYLAYLDGASIITNKCERAWPWINDICRQLRKYFLHIFGVAYLTPPGSFAVRPHSDCQDALILQCKGRKEWDIFDSPAGLPYPGEEVGKDKPVENLGDPLYSLTLEEGDLLFVPRGIIHRARTLQDADSLHVTITIPSSDLTYGMMIQRGVGSLLRDPQALPLNVDYFCRRSVHQGSLPFRVGVTEEIRDALNAIKNKLTPEYLEARLKDRISMINSQQEAARRACMAMPKPTGVISDNSLVRIACDVKCDVQQPANGRRFPKAIFTRATDEKLEVRIRPGDVEILNTLNKAAPLAFTRVADLPCRDVFEKISVLSILYDKGCIELDDDDVVDL